MTPLIVAVIIGIAAVSLFFVIARRILRWAVRLTLAGMLILVLLIGGVVAWWYSSDSSKPRETHPTAAPRRGNAR
ncbi:MAG: hypothetical protein AUG51_13185 [Acidobacteria bacterium 13_1_20CM_3_53_8]|nr:MAG: hypothetical protein AUG51_13185 [Acidobacteria bacterium 13_1_20CM_3_53_8]